MGKKTQSALAAIVLADELSIPYLFVLEGNMATSNFFMPRKEYPQITEHYLQSVKEILRN